MELPQVMCTIIQKGEKMATDEELQKIKDDIKEDIDKLRETFKEYNKDGFQMTEIVKFTFESGSALVEALNNVDTISGADKKKLVKTTVRELFDEINTNNPWIPDFIEDKLENFLLDTALDSFIDFTVKKGREKGIF
jgi:sugar-specific transcriptional regulator TrmB